MKTFGTTVITLFIFLLAGTAGFAQGIQVESAYYGQGAQSVDVTKVVQALASRGQPFRVGIETFGIDPVPGDQKVLTITYFLDGQRHMDQVPEGVTFSFAGLAGTAQVPPPNPGVAPGPAQAIPPPVSAPRVLRAIYGAEGHYVDVTALVQKLVNDGVPFEASNETFGIDPYKGEEKKLRVTFLAPDGTRVERAWDEGDHVHLGPQ